MIGLPSLCALAIGAVLLVANGAAAECKDGLVPRTELGRRHAQPATLSPTTSIAKIAHVGPNENAAYVRPLVELEHDALGEEWYLIVRDGRARPVQTLSAKDLRTSPRRWMARVPGARASVELVAKNGSQVRVKLIEYLEMPARAKNRYYSIQNPGAPKWKSLYAEDAADDARRLGDAVGMLISAFGESVWCCSGVLLAPDLLLTNWHCGGDEGSGMKPNGFWTDDVCRATIVDFSWDEDGISREYVCQSVAARSRALDYALLRVAPVSDLGALPPARLSSIGPSAGKPMYVVHHPECLPKQLSDCKIVQTQQPGWFAENGQTPPASDFTHRCDTEGGSSGSPVFSDGKVVGLHHLGFRVDAQCDPLDDVNKAVSTTEILTDLQRVAPAIAAQLAAGQ